VTTSTAPRIYTDLKTSPAYKNYEDFAALYTAKYSTPVPGLEHTDVNGKDCTSMIPQGLCIANDYMIVSAYDADSTYNSVLYVLSNTNPENRKLLTTLVLPSTAHVGGVAFDGAYLWVANGSNISSIKYSTLTSTVKQAVENSKKSVSVSYHSTCATKTTASFLTYGEGMIWVGKHTDKDDTSGRMYSYEVSADGKSITSKYYFTLPDRIQGACFKDGYLILSRSLARKTSSSSYISQLRVYKYSQPDSNGNMAKNSVVKVITLPPMVEGIATCGSYMYALFESAATKYYKGTDGNGTCAYPVDRITAFRFADFLDISDSTTELVYFAPCDSNQDSIARALDEQGYESSYAVRKVIAEANGITAYSGTAEQNIMLLDRMKAGTLINPGMTPILLSVSLDKTTASVTAGESIKINATFSSGTVTWKSNNTSVATVSVVDADTVQVTGVKEGSATITCTHSSGSTATCVVKVNAAPAEEPDTPTVPPTEPDVPTEDPNAILDKSAITILVGDTARVNVLKPQSKILWKSNNNRVATAAALDKTVVEITGRKPGTAVITCKLGDGTTATCKVTVVTDLDEVVTVKPAYFVPCDAAQTSITKALSAQNYNTSTETMKKIAEANGITGYTGTTAQNDQLLALMKEGKLINPGISPLAAYFPACDSAFESITAALESIGENSSFDFRATIAEANGITGYTGTAEQNIQMLNLLKNGTLLKPGSTAADTVSVVFNANGGSGTMAAIQLDAGASEVTLSPNSFTLKGYTFQGWSTTADGPVLYKDGDSIRVFANTTLYAVWTPNHFTVVYNANGGTGTMENTIVTYGVHADLRTPAFTREGYIQTGWYRYRTSDNKWYFISADGTTKDWYVNGTQPEGYTKQILATNSGVSKTSAIDGDTVILYAVWQENTAKVSLDGKTVLFIGNSFVYYGGAVEHGGQKKTDKGWFYEICKANGENVTVYDCTYGSHHLYDFTTSGCKSGSCHSGADLLKGIPFNSIDYVFISESGDNNSNFVKDVKNIVKRFPSSTKFIYLAHSYTYSKNHTKIINNLDNLQSMGIDIVVWGKLVDDVIDGRVSVPGATVTYKKNSFIKNKGDSYHPNPLAGYITAQMAYCALTGKTAVGQMPNLYAIGDTLKYGKSAVGYKAYISTHYNSSSNTNFKAIMNSKSDIEGLQKLMDKYLAKWGLGVNG
jgi:uncharacterized repeat protein (TIGR02543 family)